MNMVKKALKNIGFNIEELSHFMSIDKDILEGYINRYDTEDYEGIPEVILKAFSFVVNYQFIYTKEEFVAYLMSYDSHTDISEEHPAVKKIQLFLKTNDMKHIEEELNDNNIEFVVSKNKNTHFFKYFYNNIVGEVAVLDDSIYNPFAFGCREIKTIDEIKDILRGIKKIYCSALSKAQSMIEERKNMEEIEKILSEENIPSENGEIEDPDVDLDSMPTLEEDVLEQTIANMLSDCINGQFVKRIRADVLRDIRNTLLQYVEQFCLIFRGYRYAVIEDRKNFKWLLCIIDYMYDPTSPFDFTEDVIMVSGFVYYCIKRVDYQESEKIVKIAKYIDGVL